MKEGGFVPDQRTKGKGEDGGDKRGRGKNTKKEKKNKPSPWKGE